MENRPLKDIEAEIEAVEAKVVSAIDPADRTNFRIALRLLNDELTRRRWEESHQ
jgi:hypothetical protein